MRQGQDSRMVDVWLSQPTPPDADSFRVLKGMLSDWEQDRFNSLKREEDKVRYVTSHVLVRAALSELYPVAPGEWRLKQTQTGKPFVSTPWVTQEIHVSLSHTRQLVGCAIACLPVGLDIEAVSQTLEVDAMLVYTMAPQELARWACQPQGDSVKRFLRYWTLKEALAKALGVGMAVPFSSLAFDIKDSRNADLIAMPADYGEVSEWRMRLLDLVGTHVGAVAARPQIEGRFDVRVNHVEMEDLVRVAVRN